MLARIRYGIFVGAILGACARTEPASHVAPGTFAADDLTWYRIEARAPDVVLDERAGGVRFSAPAAAGAALWHVHRLDDGAYVLSNAGSGPCRRLAVARTARPVAVLLVQAAPNVPDQHWAIAPAGDGVRWRIGSEAFGARARLDAGSASPAGDPLLAAAARSEAQSWSITAAGHANEDGDCYNH